MRKTYILLSVVMLICLGCEWRLKSGDTEMGHDQSLIDRYDRIEMLYLTTGDYSALQQMQSDYPGQTRMLIEDVLHIGHVNDVGINQRFRHFFCDSTLQRLLADVQVEFASLDDVSHDLQKAFKRMRKEFPDIVLPTIYTQIGSFDQSIVVDSNMVGVSLDKYLGADYPFYLQNYSDAQRAMMTRQMIVPDCVAFYILSMFPTPDGLTKAEIHRELRAGKIQWVANQIVGRRAFRNPEVDAIDRYMKSNRHKSIQQLLNSHDAIVE